MASIYKTIRNEDIASTRTILHEAIPLTGTIVSGTYSDANIKNYTHGMFQSVYDYPYLSSSANHVFDITYGFSTGSALSSSVSSQQAKKQNIYSQMAQVLMGYDKSGNILRFDSDGDLFGTTTDKMDEVVFLTFSRLLVKDEIQKGSFNLELGTNQDDTNPFSARVSVKDIGAATDYRVNSPVGEYGILYVSNSVGTSLNGNAFDPGATAQVSQSVGLIFYQAGVVVLSGSVFTTTAEGGVLSSSAHMNADNEDFDSLFTGSLVQANADSLRKRLYNLSFNNTVELNSTIYFCHLGANEFNYSSNPTYLSGSQIVVKVDNTDDPLSYITTIGLYSSDNQLMATAKLSEAIKKTPSNSLTFRVRLDY